MRDDAFIRGEVPMTKSEVRAVSLSKLELCENSLLYDIGAGTGSVSVEAARLLPSGHVYAIEQKPEAAALIEANVSRFGVRNIEIVRGRAPEALAGLPAPTHAFIGGSSGGLKEILDGLIKRNPRVRIVINLIALESLCSLTDWLNRHDREAEIVSVQVARAERAGDYHLMRGQNPVFVITLGGDNG